MTDEGSDRTADDAPDTEGEGLLARADEGVWVMSMFVLIALLYWAVALAFGSDKDTAWAAAIGAGVVALGSGMQAYQELKKYSTAIIAVEAATGFWRLQRLEVLVQFTAGGSRNYRPRMERLVRLRIENAAIFAARPADERARLRRQRIEAMLKARSWLCIVVGTLILFMAAVHLALAAN